MSVLAFSVVSFGMAKPKWDRAMTERWFIRLMALGVASLGYIGFQ